MKLLIYLKAKLSGEIIIFYFNFHRIYILYTQYYYLVINLKSNPNSTYFDLNYYVRNLNLIIHLSLYALIFRFLNYSKGKILLKRKKKIYLFIIIKYYIITY
jgi:hypothetical protein